MELELSVSLAADRQVRFILVTKFIQVWPLLDQSGPICLSSVLPNLMWGDAHVGFMRWSWALGASPGMALGKRGLRRSLLGVYTLVEYVTARGTRNLPLGGLHSSR